jgi:hypothetical protein
VFANAFVLAGTNDTVERVQDVKKVLSSSRIEIMMNSRRLDIRTLATLASTLALLSCGGGPGKHASTGGAGGADETGGSGGVTTGGRGGSAAPGGNGGGGGGSGGSAGKGGAGSGGGSGGEARDAAVDHAPSSDDSGAPPPAGEGVLTRGYRLDRTGANLVETALNPQTVNGMGFGKLFCRPVDDEIYGQLLYVPGLELGARGKHNVVVAVTMNDSVYAYDADAAAGTPLWERHFANPAQGITPVPAGELSPTTCGVYKDVSKQIGILSTPVIDPASNTVYLVARTKENGKYVARFVALDLTSGDDRAGSPVTIDATMTGTGEGSVGGKIRFNPMTQNQRSGLLLYQGVVYFGWSAHCDEPPYHGWVLGYDATTLQQVVVFSSTTSGNKGGIWMAGQAPAVGDDGNIYLATGNGSADLQGGPNRSQSILKLRRAGNTLEVLDWFTPYNYALLEDQDRDLGSSGTMAIPGTQLLLQGGKEGVLYLVDRTKMGHFKAGSDSQIVQSIGVTGPSRAHIHGSPVHWKSTDGQYIYLMAEQDYLRQYRLVNGKLELYKMSGVMAPIEPGNRPGGYTMPGGSLAVSADGDQGGSGVVWGSMTISKDANQAVVAGVLRAFDASDVSKELWNSQQNAARDSFGNFPKFNPPTVYNGKVYQPTFSKQFCVYGRLGM